MIYGSIQELHLLINMRAPIAITCKSAGAYDIMRTILILLRSMINKMDVATILPPESVRGMKQLEKDKFKMASSVPAIRLRPQMVSQCLKRFKNLLLRQPGIKRVQDYFQVILTLKIITLL